MIKILTHFEKYPLKTHKLNDFNLFKKAFYLIVKKDHLTKSGLDNLIAIKYLMNKGLSAELVNAFPHVKLQSLSHINTEVYPDKNLDFG